MNATLRLCGLAGLAFSAFWFPDQFARADLLVARGGPGGAILRFNESSQALTGRFSFRTEAIKAMAFGPDGRIYATGNSLGQGELFQFTLNGAQTDVVMPDLLQSPGDLAFGPDGNLYVIGRTNLFPEVSATQVLRFRNDLRTFDGVFASGGTDSIWTALEFGADGNLYVADFNSGILQFDGVTGTLLKVFVPAGSGGLNDVTDFTFGPDGNLYAASRATRSVLRFDGASGGFIDEFVAPGSGGLTEPLKLTFGSDGNLYVASEPDSILRFEGSTGLFRDVFVSNAVESEFYLPRALLHVPAVPRLQLRREGDNILISWPAIPGNWKLYRRNTLSGEWLEVSAVPILIDGHWVVTEPAEGAAFYQIRQD